MKLGLKCVMNMIEDQSQGSNVQESYQIMSGDPIYWKNAHISGTTIYIQSISSFNRKGKIEEERNESLWTYR